jgi:hypothetical protein
MAIQRTLPSTKNADSSALVVVPSRTDSYLGAFTTPLGSAKMLNYADEGSYFVTYNVTDGTGIVGHAAPVQADLSTKPLLHIFNGSATKSIAIDFIRLRATAIGAGATTTDFTAWIDNHGSTVKSSGGTVATSVNVRGDQPNTTGAIVSFGAVVATAAASEKRIDHQRVRSVVAVVEDQYAFSFGHTGYNPATGGITMAGTAVIAAFVHLPPCVILPGGNFKLVQWGASQSGAHSFEYSVGWVER